MHREWAEPDAQITQSTRNARASLRPVRARERTSFGEARGWRSANDANHMVEWHPVPQEVVYGRAIMSDALVAMDALSGTSNKCDEMSPW